MHISYVIVLLENIFNKFSINRKFKYIIIIFILINFLIFINYPVSAIRAVIAQSVNLIAFCLNRRSSFLNNICISLFIILIINPYNIQSVGMWLSFGGVLGIFLFYKFIFKISYPKKLINNILKNEILKKITIFCFEQTSLNFAVQIIIFPILWYNFYSISLTSFLSNLITAPLIAPIVILGYLSMIEKFILIPIFSTINSVLVEILFFLVDLLAKLPLSIIYVKKPSIIFLVVYYVLIFLIIYKLKKNILRNFLYFFRLKSGKISFKFKAQRFKDLKTKIIIIFLILIFFFRTINFVDKKLEIYFLDVGQGDSTVIKTVDDKFILIDAGEGKKSGYDYGRNVLLPFLINKGARKIDFIFISHFDNDHIGGVFSLIEEFRIGEIFISNQKSGSENFERFLKVTRENRIKVNVVKQGDRINLEENLYMDILWPKEKEQISENPMNNNSIVSKLVYKNFSILFTGDIEEIAEKEILNLYKNKNTLEATVLKVAHHGSRTSSSIEFLKAVKPKYALIGVGKNNKFNHPSSDVVQNLEKNKIIICRTDLMGQITILINTNGAIKVKSYINLQKN